MGDYTLEQRIRHRIWRTLQPGRAGYTFARYGGAGRIKALWHGLGSLLRLNTMIDGGGWRWRRRIIGMRINWLKDDVTWTSQEIDMTPPSRLRRIWWRIRYGPM